MNFWKKIFKSKKIDESINSFPPKNEEYNSYYSNSWVNLEIPEIDRTIIELIYKEDLVENNINEFLKTNSESGFEGSGWGVKGILNFPGPFYTGESDTCGTGIIESPNNVIFDEYCMEHVMIQPRNVVELLQLWNAGAVEVFGSYYCDGNKHWTIQLVRNWWSNRGEILRHLNKEELIDMNCNQEKRYSHYIEKFAEFDLRKYCFFLDNGFYPTNEKLPELE